MSIHLNSVGDHSTDPFERYPMSADQRAQIDCRQTSCIHYKGAGKCVNVSPAITLNENGRFVCWSESEHERPQANITINITGFRCPNCSHEIKA